MAAPAEPPSRAPVPSSSGTSAGRTGLSSQEAARRLREIGPNAVRTNQVEWLRVLLPQLRSPLLLLLAVAALVSFFVGERTDAVIIGVILVVSVGLGFVNEYRAARAAEALHSRIRHETTVLRDGRPVRVDIVEIVPGDLVEIERGQVVPADVLLLTAAGLACDEGILTGESAPVVKAPSPEVAGGPAEREQGDLGDDTRAWMGTVVVGGSARALVVATGGRTVFGRLALALGERSPETEFQTGLRHFSGMLVIVAAALTSFVFLANLVLHRPLLDALLFSLAIAVGITPQLLPAIVSTSLTVGSRTLARRRVLVKRLVCIEDLGDIQVLMTDKTGTLTEGRIELMRSVGVDGRPSADVVPLALVCSSESVDASPADGYSGSDALDAALWRSPLARVDPPESRARRLAVLPFDHERQLVSVVIEHQGGRRELVTKGAPEQVLARCVDVPGQAQAIQEAEFRAGGRVVAVARRPWVDDPPSEVPTMGEDDERALGLVGFLVFSDPPKASAGQALEQLRVLGIETKVITGDNPLVAQHVCGELGLEVRGVLTGSDLRGVDDTALPDLVAATTVFARVSPEDKRRIVRAQRAGGQDVAYLGDGVNDAAAIHAADIGISVDTATDVAKDAADIVLLEKDLGVLADGVMEGRRIFANTIKYVLMGTSSNFGNMFSAAIASAALPFLPMLPAQILLGNLLYDTSQLAIPGDTVDAEQLRRPSHWDLRLVRRCMLLFGPISSVFDLAMFGVLIRGFHADAELFHSGWFVESLATQSLVIFAIRTWRSPSLRSRPSLGLFASVTGLVLLGAALPFTPLARPLGLVPLPGALVAVIIGVVVTYLGIVEFAKRWVFQVAGSVRPAPRGRRRSEHERRVHRRAARFSAPGDATHVPGARRPTDSAGRHTG